jgi:hypothetical protein
MNVFYIDSKTDLKLRCESHVNSSYSGVSKMFLVDWRLCVECYYPTTPTDYPSTTRGTSVGPSTTVNIDFCGYLQCWTLLLSELYGYSTPRITLLDNNKSSIHRPVLIFQPTVSSRPSDKQGKLCHQQHNSLTELHSFCVSDIWIRVFGRV